MSIRKKLLATYVLLVIVPMALLILVVSILTAPALSRVDSSIETLMTELKQSTILPVLKSLQTAQSESPQILKDQTYLKDFFDHHTQLVTFEVLYEGQRSFYDERPLPVEIDNEKRIQHDAFQFNDGKGLYLVKVSFVSTYAMLGGEDIRTMMAERFQLGVLTFAALHLVFVLFLMKYFLTPFKELKQLANQVRQKNYDFEIDTSRNDEIGQTFQAFDEMRHAIATYETSRKELVANISHDLKTPLTSLKGYITAIQDGVATDAQRLEKYLNIMQKNVTHMDLLVEDLKLFSKLDVDQVTFDFQPVPFNKFMEYLIDDIRFDAEKEGVRVFWEDNSQEGLICQMDTFKIRRVVLNIVNNALTHMHKTEKTLHFELKRSGDRAELSIRDNGKGISPEDLPLVFDRFYRADASRNTDIGGSGLGLAISKQILEKHGASLRIDSVLGVYTKVIIDMPIAEVSGGERS